MPKFDANLSMMFPELEMPQRFAAARDAGFSAIELLRPYEHDVADLRGWIEDAGLELVLINSPSGNPEAGERGLACLPGREQDFRKTFDEALKYATMANAKMIHVLAGVPPEGVAREKCEETFVWNLQVAADAARTLRLKISLEPLNQRDAPGYLYTNTADCRRLMAGIGRDNVFLQYDLYHMQIMQGDLVEHLRDNLDVIGHIQFSSLPGRNEPQHGEANLPYVFDQIDALGYTGWVGCEYRPKAGTLEGLTAWGKSYGLGTR